MRRNALLAILAAALFALLLVMCTAVQAADEVQMLKTPSGIRFAMVGEKGERPAPTLLVFAQSARASLHDDDYFESGRLLLPKKWVCISLDTPAHDEDARAGEPQGLKGWRARLDHQEDFMAPFVERCRAVLDHLVREGYSDPERIAVSGISRGGLCAFHLAAAEPRVKWILAFAPVTDLPVLEEFKGLENDTLTKSLAASSLAQKLVGKRTWVCIGNNDGRVGSDECFAFVRAVARANLAAGKPASIELHMMPSEGHRIHDTAHAEAAEWLSKIVK